MKGVKLFVRRDTEVTVSSSVQGWFQNLLKSGRLEEAKSEEHKIGVTID